MIEGLYGEYRPDAPVSGGRWGATGKAEQVGLEINKGQKTDPNWSWNWYHPGRYGVQLAPDAFRSQLHEIDSRLEVVFHPLRQRWVCWFREPTITWWMCKGWKKLFVIKYPDGEFMPLDERTLGEAWTRNPKLYDYKGRQFFERVVVENMRDQMAAEVRERESFVEAVAHDQYRFAQIKNIGQGNKYTNHEVGD